MTIKEFEPLKVYYPHAGKMLMLHWWTYRDRGHVVLARTEESMLKTAQRVFNDNCDAEIRRYFEIEMVAPPTKLCELAAKYDYRENVEGFYRQVWCRLQEVINKGYSLPEQFGICNNFEYFYADECDKEDLNWKSKNHYDCKNCFEGIVFGMTSEELYERYSKQWNDLGIGRDTSGRKLLRSSDKKRLPSRARVAEYNEKIFCAVANFGHHSSGIDFEEAKQEEDSEISIRPNYLSRSALFFYKKIGQLDTSKLQSILDEVKQKRIDMEKKTSRAEADRYERENIERINDVLDFFKNH